MPSLTLVVVLLILIFSYNVDGDVEHQESCSRRCGVHSISHPFRLKDSPEKCGDKRYILSCEDNNQLILYYEFEEYHGKYYVQSINYNNFTIRLLDFNLASSNNSIPSYYSLGLYNFSSNFFTSPYLAYHRYKNYTNHMLTKSMLYVSCPNRMEYSYIGNCMNRTSYSQDVNSFYVGGYGKSLLEFGLGDGCHIEFMYLTWDVEDDGNINNISCTDIRRRMYYGFELSWLNSRCKHGRYAVLDQYNQPHCKYGVLVGLLSGVKFVLGLPFIIVLLIKKWRKKHQSMYDGVEDFLSSDNSIIPIRYSYKEIKKITGNFMTKLGNGGYGSVFKGQLRSGRLVAVKLLDSAKSNDRDFVNEVATIGRIHHVNVVQLIGFCVEGSKRVLIYEFMPNGSLEKYIFSHTEENYSLSCEQLYSISLGVARGIEYLHNGCNMKILHFDIKPHNILLDENFNPKVSDFGLARLCPTDKSIVSLTAARGTIGYMAPELFYRNVGTISYKADVYSFGMLLMEMANRRKNLDVLAGQSSQVYFPFWVYDQLQDGREITIENATNHEMKLAKKMMIVALWCIQAKPSDRPPMDKVLEMLEEEDEDLQMPNQPDLDAQDVRDDRTGSSLYSSGTLVTDSKEPI
ncbi:stress-induced receptor-like kinase [Medicago truncatula]|uniref:Stress-induced receptor-like kinase n=1 Tax=Medicago truncatula TaxID=3880 RepID=G7I977_MEDTR|nr:stress-induced receptor-like kinase [Medicago truncatula]